MTVCRSLTARPIDREHGASLVEFALVLPLLVCILLGVITGGSALASKNSMTNAVREGARLGATLPKDESSGWDTWAADVRGRVVQVAGGDLQSDEVCAELVALDMTDPPTDPPTVTESVLAQWPSTGCAGSLAGERPDTPDSATPGTCLVKVWAQRDVTLDALFFARTFDIEADTVGLYERTPCVETP